LGGLRKIDDSASYAGLAEELLDEFGNSLAGRAILVFLIGRWVRVFGVGFQPGTTK